MSQLTHGSLVSTTYGMYDSVARRFLVYSQLRVYAPRQTGKSAYKRAGEKEKGVEGKGKERKKETKRVTKVAPIALSAPFLEDLLRFCRNPIALSAIKPESCPVKGW